MPGAGYMHACSYQGRNAGKVQRSISKRWWAQHMDGSAHSYRCWVCKQGCGRYHAMPHKQPGARAAGDSWGAGGQPTWGLGCWGDQPLVGQIEDCLVDPAEYRTHISVDICAHNRRCGEAHGASQGEQGGQAVGAPAPSASAARPHFHANRGTDSFVA